MGAWFYMTAVGNFVAGKIGEATGGHGGEMSKEKLLDDLRDVRLDLDRRGCRRPGALAVREAAGCTSTRCRTRSLAGRDELAEPQAPGMFPQGETEPAAQRLAVGTGA